MATNFRLPDEKDNRILSEAEDLIRRYLEARDGLKNLGVIRTERTFQGDYAEWIVSRMLDLDLSESSIETGIDGTRISQIKLAAVSKHCEDGVCSSKIAILDDILGGTLWVKPERMGCGYISILAYG